MNIGSAVQTLLMASLSSVESEKSAASAFSRMCFKFVDLGIARNDFCEIIQFNAIWEGVFSYLTPISNNSFRLSSPSGRDRQ